jgi:hypothetical protein
MHLDELNDTELWEIARLQLSSAWCKPIRLSRNVPRERVMYLIEANQPPEPREVLIETRLRLQQWVKKNWDLVNSQLPCQGPDRGKCTEYACPEGRHLTCFKSAAPHFLV